MSRKPKTKGAWRPTILSSLAILLGFAIVSQIPANVLNLKSPAETANQDSAKSAVKQDDKSNADQDPPASGDDNKADKSPDQKKADENKKGDAKVNLDDLGIQPRKEQPQWIQDVDKNFGEKVVTPMGKVIFNQMYTADWTETVELDDGTKEEITHKGWLGTGVPFIVVWLFVGAIFFTIFMGFINLRGFWHAIRLTKGDYDNPKDEGEVSHFQALSSALSGTVGLGNIAGVAIAIGMGGPGATFWIIVVGLLGMTSKFTECTLGQMYRKVDENGQVSGGPMRYLSQGLKEMKLGPLGSVLAVLFAVLCIGGSFGGGNTFQISQSLDIVKSEVRFFDSYPWIYGLVMCVAIGLVIVGGIKSIGRVASRIVPFMCVGYVICVVYILFSNASEIPMAFGRIFSEAFSPKAAYGGFIGVLVIGIKRAVFSNEAGAGSASIAHSAAKTDIPVREGFVALLEPFIDTVVVCTMTALVIVITGVCDNPTEKVSLETLEIELISAGADPDKVGQLNEEQAAEYLLAYDNSLDANGDGVLKVEDYISKDRGAFFTKLAFATTGQKVFVWFLIVAVMLFAYSTCITWYYYGERCFTTLFGTRSSIVFKVLFLSFTFLGSIVATTAIKDFSDMLILGMAFPNMLGMYFLCGKVRRELNDYWSKYTAGEIKPYKKK
jgi:AGCS family alanine or glycine:cation symporter